jgi:hypothetical protein
MMRAIKDWLWQELASILCWPSIANWLIRRAKRTPYRHLLDPDGSVYMERYWLFNAYPNPNKDVYSYSNAPKRYWSWLPSIRLHWIAREDRDRHMHDHPWDARTIVLKGWYIEERLEHRAVTYLRAIRHHRLTGSTARLNLEMFHRIATVSPGGVWTLFITWKKYDDWGFLVDGQKIGYREYLNLPAQEKE